MAVAGLSLALILLTTDAVRGDEPPRALRGWQYRWDDPVDRPPHGPFRWPDERWISIDDPNLSVPDRNGRDRVWLRVRLPQGQWADPAVFFGGVDSCFRAYVGTREVASSGDVEECPFRLGWPWHLFRVGRLEPNDALVLQVHSRDPFHLGPFGEVAIGDRSDLLAPMIRRDLPQGGAALALAVLGAEAMLVFALRRDQKPFLHFGLYGVTRGAGLVAFTDVKQLVLDAPEAWHLVMLCGRAVAPAMLVAFWAEIIGSSQRRRLGKVSLAVAAIGLALVGAAWLSYPAMRGPVMLFLNAEFVASVVTLCALTAVGLARKTRVARLLLPALAIMIGMTGYEVLVVTGAIAGASAAGAWGQLTAGGAMGVVLVTRMAEAFDAERSAVRARDELLSIASHELRNPLAVIAAESTLLARIPGAGDRAAAISRQVQHLSRLVDDLLDVSRIAHGKLTLKTEPVALASALAASAEAVRPLAEEQGVHVVLEPAAEALFVAADPTRLDQILGNVLRNAVKYTPAGGSVRVTASRSGAFAEIRIADSGVGMDEETLAGLFTLFGRGRADVRGGMGVGLALVKQLVERHGGTVTAASAGPGQGSEITLRLPLCPPPEAMHEAARPAPQALARRRVLLVDDNARLRTTLRIALQLCGFEVAEAGDGESGMARLACGAFDAAVVDLHMPGIDGYELARRARALYGRSLRLVALTGFGQDEAIARAEQAGFDRVLVKPTDPEELARLLAG